MEHLDMVEAKFIDRKTIQLSEEYFFESRNVRLIIILEKEVMKKRIPGLLKGKVRKAEDFNAPLDDLKEYIGGLTSICR